MLEVLYGTGVRISELVGLSLADVDLDGRCCRAFGKGDEGAHRARSAARLGRRSRDWLDRGRPRSSRSAGRGGATPKPCSSTRAAAG